MPVSARRTAALATALTVLALAMIVSVPPMARLAREGRRRVFAWVMSMAMSGYNEALHERKVALFAQLPASVRAGDAPTVVEVGIGTGANFAYYPNGTRVVGALALGLLHPSPVLPMMTRPSGTAQRSSRMPTCSRIC